MPRWDSERAVSGPYRQRKMADGSIVREHTLIAEHALGKPLPEGAVVHHINGIGTDNRPENLVVCQDRAYHMLLHERTRVLRLGGLPGLERWCPGCKRLVAIGEFRRRKNGLRNGKIHSYC